MMHVQKNMKLIYLVILIFVAKFFGPSDHHLSILQKLKVHAVQSCSMGSHKTYNCMKYVLTFWSRNFTFKF